MATLVPKKGVHVAKQHYLPCLLARWSEMMDKQARRLNWSLRLRNEPARRPTRPKHRSQRYRELNFSFLWVLRGLKTPTISSGTHFKERRAWQYTWIKSEGTIPIDCPPVQISGTDIGDLYIHVCNGVAEFWTWRERDGARGWSRVRIGEPHPSRPDKYGLGMAPASRMLHLPTWVTHHTVSTYRWKARKMDAA